jgi:hypothetical protein
VLAEQQADVTRRVAEPALDQHTVAQLQTQLAAAIDDAVLVRAEVRATYEYVRQQQAQHDIVLRNQRDEVQYYRQQISMLERILADGQVAQQHAHEQAAQAQLPQAAPQALAAQYEVALRDLTERAAWLERQATAARRELEAVQRGRVLRFLNYLAGRIK